jgi:hypothetical protein
VPAKGIDDDLGDQWLSQPGKPTDEAQEPTANQRPAVRANIGEQQAPGGLPVG